MEAPEKELFVITADSREAAADYASALSPYMKLGLRFSSYSFIDNKDNYFYQYYGYFVSSDYLTIIQAAGEMIDPKYQQFQYKFLNLSRKPETSERVILVDSKENIERLFSTLPKIDELFRSENFLDFSTRQ